MAQTEYGQTFRVADVDLKRLVGDSWTAISGHGAGISTGGGSRAVGKQHTYEGDTPIIKAGKRDSKTVTIRFVYTEEALEPFELARDIYETAGGACYVRYFPLGMEAGNFEYNSGLAIMTEFLYPEGEPDPGEVIMGEFTVECTKIEKTAASGS